MELAFAISAGRGEVAEAIEIVKSGPPVRPRQLSDINAKKAIGYPNTREEKSRVLIPGIRRSIPNKRLGGFGAHLEKGSWASRITSRHVGS